MVPLIWSKLLKTCIDSNLSLIFRFGVKAQLINDMLHKRKDQLEQFLHDRGIEDIKTVYNYRDNYLQDCLFYERENENKFLNLQIESTIKEHNDNNVGEASEYPGIEEEETIEYPDMEELD